MVCESKSQRGSEKENENRIENESGEKKNLPYNIALLQTNKIFVL